MLAVPRAERKRIFSGWQETARSLRQQIKRTPPYRASRLNLGGYLSFRGFQFLELCRKIVATRDHGAVLETNQIGLAGGR